MRLLGLHPVRARRRGSEPTALPALMSSLGQAWPAFRFALAPYLRVHTLISNKRSNAYRYERCDAVVIGPAACEDGRSKSRQISPGCYWTLGGGLVWPDRGSGALKLKRGASEQPGCEARRHASASSSLGTLSTHTRDNGLQSGIAQGDAFSQPWHAILDCEVQQDTASRKVA